MDLTKFQNFLKEKIIIVNYPTGCFGGFLTNILYQSENVLTPDGLLLDIFSSTGASHHTYIKTINKFHNIDPIAEWTKLDRLQKLEYLWENFHKEYITTQKYIVVKVCCPQFNDHLCEFFDPNKTFIIKPEAKHFDLLQNLIFHKSLLEYKEYNSLKRFKIDFNKNQEKLKKVIAKTSARFFINDIDYNHDFIIELDTFFSWDRFTSTVNSIEKQLSIKFNHDNIKILYDNFRKLNEQYISPYLATQSHA